MNDIIIQIAITFTLITNIPLLTREARGEPYSLRKLLTVSSFVNRDIFCNKNIYELTSLFNSNHVKFQDLHQIILICQHAASHNGYKRREYGHLGSLTLVTVTNFHCKLLQCDIYNSVVSEAEAGSFLSVRQLLWLAWRLPVSRAWKAQGGGQYKIPAIIFH